MQNASLTTHVMVGYLPGTGPANATLMINTLGQRHCGVIITTGTAAPQRIGQAIHTLASAA